MTRTLTVANLKGGTAKTTTAAFLAHCLPNVLAVDADPAGSLYRWSQAGWTVPAVELPVKNLHTRIPGISGKYDWVVIDTPPLDDQAGIVYSALRAADVVVVPVSPTTMEMDRLAPILDAVEMVARQKVIVRILLTRTTHRTTSIGNARQLLTEHGLTVLPTVVPRLERYAQAFGQPIEVAPDDLYAQAARELLETLAVAA